MGNQARNITPIQNDLSILLSDTQAKVGGLLAILSNAAEGELSGLTAYQLTSLLDPIDKDLSAALQQMGCKPE